jgi:hypothetical protein
MLTHEIYPYEMTPIRYARMRHISHDMHIRDMHARKTHALEMHAYEVHAWLELVGGVGGETTQNDVVFETVLQDLESLVCPDYYGVTFDHLVPADDPDPEVLVINIIEVDNDGGEYADGGKYANEVLLFPVNPTEYTGQKYSPCRDVVSIRKARRIVGE